MYYSTLTARSLIKMSRSIGQGGLVFIVLIGLNFIHMPIFVIASIFILTPFFIGRHRPLHPVFRFLKQCICKIYVLPIYQHLGTAWVCWGVCCLLKGLFFPEGTIAIYPFHTLPAALLIFSFLTLIALTLLKIMLCAIHTQTNNLALFSHKEKNEDEEKK